MKKILLTILTCISVTSLMGCTVIVDNPEYKSLAGKNIAGISFVEDSRYENKEDATEEAITEETQEEGSIEESVSEEKEEVKEEPKYKTIDTAVTVDEFEKLSKYTDDIPVEAVYIRGVELIDEDLNPYDISEMEATLHKLSKFSLSMEINGEEITKKFRLDETMDLFFHDLTVGEPVKAKYHYDGGDINVDIIMSDDPSLYKTVDGALYPGYTTVFKEVDIYIVPDADDIKFSVETEDGDYWYLTNDLVIKSVLGEKKREKADGVGGVGMLGVQ